MKAGIVKKPSGLRRGSLAAWCCRSPAQPVERGEVLVGDGAPAREEVRKETRPCQDIAREERPKLGVHRRLKRGSVFRVAVGSFESLGGS